MPMPTFSSFSELKKKFLKPLYAFPEFLEYQNTDTYDYYFISVDD